MIGSKITNPAPRRNRRLAAFLRKNEARSGWRLRRFVAARSKALDRDKVGEGEHVD